MVGKWRDKIFTVLRKVVQSLPSRVYLPYYQSFYCLYGNFLALKANHLKRKNIKCINIGPISTLRFWQPSKDFEILRNRERTEIIEYFDPYFPTTKTPEFG